MLKEIKAIRKQPRDAVDQAGYFALEKVLKVIRQFHATTRDGELERLLKEAEDHFDQIEQ